MSTLFRIQKKADWLLYLALTLVLIGGLGPLAVQLFAPDPMKFSNLPLPVESPVNRGEPIKVTVGRCNYEGHDVVAVRTRALQQIMSDGSEGQRRYILPADSSTVPAGCTFFTAVATTIPDIVVPGTYRLEGILTFRGRWKTVDASYYTQPFLVVE